MRKVTRNSDSTITNCTKSFCTHWRDHPFARIGIEIPHYWKQQCWKMLLWIMCFYTPSRSVLLLCPILTPKVYIYFFFGRGTVLLGVSGEKSTQEGKKKTTQTSSLCKWAPSILLVAKGDYHITLRLQNFIITLWKMSLSFRTRIVSV